MTSIMNNVSYGSLRLNNWNFLYFEYTDTKSVEITHTQTRVRLPAHTNTQTLSSYMTMRKTHLIQFISNLSNSIY